MTLKKLLALTLDTCRIQFISECVTRIHAKKTHSLITIATDCVTPDSIINPDSAPYVGVIVWIPRATYYELATQEEVQP